MRSQLQEIAQQTKKLKNLLKAHVYWPKLN